MENIIERLDKEKLNLQETMLNLEKQGYKEVLNNWLKSLMETAIWDLQLKWIKEDLKKNKLF